jgi:Zn-dependent protease with chaperone function
MTIIRLRRRISLAFDAPFPVALSPENTMYALHTPATGQASAPIRIPRWPTERPLFVAIVVFAIGIWALLAISIIGAVYAAMIAIFLFFAHVVFITHIRGSGVRLGPDQFPHLWERVVALSQKAGLEAPPEAYLVQAGGSLNAFATKLFRGRMIVLFAELLDACGDDEGARDMVIGHELAHLKLGHLDWFWLTAPARFVPFLGHAYSRACEYSCDRWGTALCGDRDGAMRGLSILAAGGTHGGKVNLQAFVAQRQALDTGWMTIGSWLSGYPPLSARIEAIEPIFGKGIPYSTRGPMRAALILSAFIIVPWVVSMGAMALWMSTFAALLQPPAETSSYDSSYDDYVPTLTPEEQNAKALADLATLTEVMRAHHAATGERIEDDEALNEVWSTYRGDEAIPADPYDGLAYGFRATDAGARIFSSGPDTESETDDDLSAEVVYADATATAPASD